MIFSIISIASEPILTFGLLLLLILFVPILFQKINLPGIVGLLIAGTLVGPKGLGLIEAAGVIDVIGKVGLLYLMFLAGLEINLDQFKKEYKNTLVFGFFTFFIPQLCGTLIFFWLGYSLAASLLIASMFASHTLVAYPIITRLGLMKEKSIAAAVGGTIITDVAALLVLAVVAKSVDGNLDAAFWLTLSALFSLYMIFMFLILPRISFSFFKVIGEKGRFTYVYVIGMMLMASWLAEVIGLEAIVGAFMAGLAFNRLLSNKGPLKNRVEFFGDAFFIPLFLIFVGMHVELEVLTSSSEVWFIMGVMTLTVIITKWLAAFSSAKLLGFDNNQAWVVFGLTNSQAAATLAAVFVGMEIGLIGDEILNGAIMMILATCIIGPIVVEKFGPELTGEAPSGPETTKGFKQRIMIPLVNPDTSARLIEFAANIKLQETSPVYPLYVMNTIQNPETQREHAQKILETASKHIHAVNSESESLLEINLNVAEGIHRAAEKNSITEIVLGWNGKISTSFQIFGSVLDQVLSSTYQQLYICKLEQPIAVFRKTKLILSPKKAAGPGFLKLFKSLINLCEHLKTPVEICIRADEKEIIQKNLVLISSDLKITLREFENFDQLMEEVIEEVEPTDLLIVTNKRKDSYGWAYGTNLVPRRLAEKKPNVSFVLAYPKNLEGNKHNADLVY